VDFLPKVKIEIALADELVPKTIEAIVKAAKTGKIGDGKVFILPLDEIVRHPHRRTRAKPPSDGRFSPCVKPTGLLPGAGFFSPIRSPGGHKPERYIWATAHFKVQEPNGKGGLSLAPSGRPRKTRRVKDNAPYS